jgi:hypothetical protein
MMGGMNATAMMMNITHKSLMPINRTVIGLLSAYLNIWGFLFVQNGLLIAFIPPYRNPSPEYCQGASKRLKMGFLAPLNAESGGSRNRK